MELPHAIRLGPHRQQSAEEPGSRAGIDGQAQEFIPLDGANPITQRELLNRFRHAPVRMPRSRSELFQLLALYNPHIGLAEFVRMIDFADVTPSQIYQVVLGRPPESVELAVVHPGYDPREHFQGALQSTEFRQKILKFFLQAYPAKGRDVFIHIPKCAGTDLILNLGLRSVPLPKMLAIEGWIPRTEFLEIVAGLARAAMSHERLFVYGHMELGEYVDLAGIRPDDRVFTVLREPMDLMISQANYAVGRIRQDPTGQDPDAAEYLRWLGLTRIPEHIGSGDLKDLTVKALLNRQVAEPNRACFYLGRGFHARYATAMENLIIHNVEITTTNNYDRWLKERWGIAESARHNRSASILSNTEARRLCGAALADEIAEDQKLYDVVSWALRQSNAASVTGQDLARLVGPPLTETLPANAIPPLPPLPDGARPEVKILVAQADRNVELYLAPVSVVVPGSAEIESILSIGVRANTGVDDYLREGWGMPEVKHTWTASERCTILLPPLRGEGCFVFRLILSPFVAPPGLLFQQLDLTIEGVDLGSCKVKDRSVIEARLPPELVRDRDRVTIALNIPTAARPSDVSNSGDERLLGFAVQSMTVFRVAPPGTIV